jgi:hypothetical protein
MDLSELWKHQLTAYGALTAAFFFGIATGCLIAGLMFRRALKHASEEYRAGTERIHQEFVALVSQAVAAMRSGDHAAFMRELLKMEDSLLREAPARKPEPVTTK